MDKATPKKFLAPASSIGCQRLLAITAQDNAASANLLARLGFVHAGKVFGERECVVISQEFHVQRALYLARVKAMVDVHILHSGPTYLGPLEVEA